MGASETENAGVAMLGVSSLAWWISDTDLTTAKDGTVKSVQIGAEPRSGKSTGRAVLCFADAAQRDAFVPVLTDKFGADVRSEVLDEARAATFLNPPPPPPPVAAGFRPPPGFPPPPGMFPPAIPPPGMFPPGMPPPPQLLQMMFRANANGKPPIAPPAMPVPPSTTKKEEKDGNATGNAVVSKPPDVKSDRESSRRERSPRRDDEYRRSSRRRSRSRSPDRRRRSRSPGYSRRRRSPSPKRRRDDDYDRGYRRSRRRSRSRSPRRRDRSPIRGRGRTPPRGERRSERGRTPPRGERRRTPPRGERRRTPPRGERRRTPPRGEKDNTPPRGERRISPAEQTRGSRERSPERRRGSRERSNSKGRPSRDRSRERNATPPRAAPNQDKAGVPGGRSPSRVEKERGDSGGRPGMSDRLNMPLSELEKDDINDSGLSGRSRRRRGGRKTKRSASGGATNGAYSVDDPSRKRAKLGGRR